MRQTDKCECESLRKDNTCYFDFEKCQHINNWKSCVRYNKSHSQKIPSQTKDKTLKSVGNVRASEEERQESGYVGCKGKYSSVPYAPLTKDNWYYHDRDDYKAKVVELNKVLTALNGLREDLCRCQKDSKCGNCHKIDKWFPILNDGVKKE